ncbi:scabin-related ADP-ribosyltransferase [Mycobacterium simiae]|uniref:scabin-related ADP-ribosyltransferase n=1 Tax=Mycobacterium simiae TaxID=1784 RepID=UPI00111C329B|nr:hypothetical protein [Mycobacterium simiae]
MERELGEGSPERDAGPLRLRGGAGEQDVGGRGLESLPSAQLDPSVDLRDVTGLVDGAAVHFRTDDDPLFRDDTRDPADVFQSGFAPLDPTNTNLESFGRGRPGAFVSTTRDPQLNHLGPPTEARPRVFRYRIQAPGGIDINATAPHHQDVHEREIVFPGGIRRENIAGAEEVLSGPPGPLDLGPFIDNPNFDPGAPNPHFPTADRLDEPHWSDSDDDDDLTPTNTPRARPVSLDPSQTPDDIGAGNQGKPDLHTDDALPDHDAAPQRPPGGVGEEDIDDRDSGAHQNRSAVDASVRSHEPPASGAGELRDVMPDQPDNSLVAFPPHVEATAPSPLRSRSGLTEAAHVSGAARKPSHDPVEQSDTPHAHSAGPATTDTTDGGGEGVSRGGEPDSELVEQGDSSSDSHRAALAVKGSGVGLPVARAVHDDGAHQSFGRGAAEPHRGSSGFPVESDSVVAAGGWRGVRTPFEEWQRLVRADPERAAAVLADASKMLEDTGIEGEWVQRAYGGLSEGERRLNTRALAQVLVHRVLTGESYPGGKGGVRDRSGHHDNAENSDHDTDPSDHDNDHEPGPSHTGFASSQIETRDLLVSRGGEIALQLRRQTHQIYVGAGYRGTRLRVQVVDDGRVVTVFDPDTGDRIGRMITIDPNDGRTSHSVHAPDPNARILKVSSEAAIGFRLHGQRHQVRVGMDYVGTYVPIRIVDGRVVTVFDAQGRQIGESITIDPNGGRTSHSVHPPPDRNNRNLKVTDKGIITLSLNGQPHTVGVGKEFAGRRVGVRIVEDHAVTVVTVFEPQGRQIGGSITIDPNSDRTSHSVHPTRDPNNRNLKVTDKGIITLSLNGQPHTLGLGKQYADRRVRVQIVDDRVVTVFDSAGNQIGETVTINPDRNYSSVHSSVRGGAGGDGSGVKRERSASPIVVEPVAGVGSLHEHSLDQSRTGFRVQIGEYGDLTSDTTHWEPRFDPGNQVIIHHQMEPIGWLDNVFPMRDLDDPLRRVHPDFADADGFVHPRVRLDRVQLADTVREAQRRVPVPGAVLEGLGRVVHAELDRLMNNSRRGSVSRDGVVRIEPRRLTPADVQPHERPLIGQYGLFATPRAGTAHQGQILGIYLGALLHGEADEERARALHPGSHRYMMDVGGASSSKVSTYSADGGGNSTAFANTALLPFSPRQIPSYDHGRINAAFLGFRVDLTDNQGRPTHEYVSVLVGLDNLRPGDPVLVSYGTPFLNQFQGPSAREQRAQRRAADPEPKRIKTEHHETERMDIDASPQPRPTPQARPAQQFPAAGPSQSRGLTPQPARSSHPPQAPSGAGLSGRPAPPPVAGPSHSRGFPPQPPGSSSHRPPAPSGGGLFGRPAAPPPWVADLARQFAQPGGPPANLWTQFTRHALQPLPLAPAFVDQFSENIRRQIGSQRPEDQPDALVQYLQGWLERTQPYPIRGRVQVNIAAPPDSRVANRPANSRRDNDPEAPCLDRD